MILSLLISVQASAANPIRINGMGPMTAMATAVSNKIAEQKKIPISVKGEGGAAGVNCVVDKSCEIGLVPSVPAEVKPNVVVTELGISAMGFLVTSDIKIAGLTTQQVKDIFSGKITNWKDVGGPDQPMLVRDRLRGRGAREVFEKTFGLKEIFQEKSAVASFQELSNRLKFEEGIKGLITYDAAYQAKKSDKVRVLALDGIEPTQENVLNGKYKFVLNYLLITHRDKAQDPILKEISDAILESRGQYFPEMGIVFKGR